MSEAEDRPYLVEFAELLAAVRQQARMKVRQLGDAIGYTHPHVSRATSGKTLPSWPLTAAYLKGCGLADDEVEVWLRLWAVAKSKEREFRRTRQTATDDPEWQAAVAEARSSSTERAQPPALARRSVTH